MKKLKFVLCIIAVFAANIVFSSFAYGVSKSALQKNSSVKGSSKTAVKSVKGKKLNIHAFYSGKTNYDDNTEGYIKSLNSISFAWLSLKNQNGSVVLDGTDQKTDFHIPDDYDRPLAVCKANNIPAQLAIFSDGDTAKSIISDSVLKEDLINKIADSMSMKLPDGTSYDFNGVVIDFEGFRNSDTSAYFNSFLSDLKTKLGGMNKKIYVAVNVRSYWPGYDYKGILQYADKVILMAHDYAPSGSLTKGDILKYINYSSSNPIFTLAPINKVKEATEDLTGAVNSPADMDKIWLQINFGISQWQFTADSTDAWKALDNSTVSTKVSPTYDMLQSRINNQDKLSTDMNIGYIKDLESPYLSYYNLQSKTFNFILYEDSQSIKAKTDLAKLEGIDGVSLWRLGNVPAVNDGLGGSSKGVWDTILDAAR